MGHCIGVSCVHSPLSISPGTVWTLLFWGLWSVVDLLLHCLLFAVAMVHWKLLLVLWMDWGCFLMFGGWLARRRRAGIGFVLGWLLLSLGCCGIASNYCNICIIRESITKTMFYKTWLFSWNFDMTIIKNFRIQIYQFVSQKILYQNTK